MNIAHPIIVSVNSMASVDRLSQFTEKLSLWLMPAEIERAPKQPVSMQKPISTAPANRLPVFDSTGLMDRVLNDKDLAIDVLEEFSSNLPYQIANLKSLISALEPIQVSAMAHKIKGASAVVGGERLRNLMDYIERIAKSGELNTILSRVDEISTECIALMEAIRYYRQTELA